MHISDAIISLVAITHKMDSPVLDRFQSSKLTIIEAHTTDVYSTMGLLYSYVN